MAVLYLEGVLDEEKQYGTMEFEQKGHICKIVKSTGALRRPRNNLRAECGGFILHGSGSTEAQKKRLFPFLLVAGV